jgi:acyl-coenzyme A synthetase/AMP-(fatty) acid ligase
VSRGLTRRPGQQPEEYAFATSGSTGEPVVWLRSRDQVEYEAGLLATACGAEDADGVVCFAPPTHLYGHLMGIALPRQLGLPGRLVRLTQPLRWAFAGLRRPVVAAMPGAVAALTHSLPTLRRLDRLVLVHGSSVLTPATVRLLAELGRRARLVDLFGSTETGLVATRHAADAVWSPAPDVTLHTEVGTGRLVVASPRIAHRPGTPAQTEAVLEDVVTLHPDGTFRWVGRASRLLKVNGRRVYLDQVEATLRAAVPDAVTRCEPDRDPQRGEWFDVVVDSTGRRGVRAVERACQALPAYQRPRLVRAG